ncbi:MAG: T9SS type A sorting domain-containing protein, partial [Bacteroidota bacterium]
LTLRDSATVSTTGASSNVALNASSFVDGPLNWEIENAAAVTRDFPVGKTQDIGGYLFGDFRNFRLDVDLDAATRTTFTTEMFLADRSTTYTWPSPVPETIVWISEQRYWNCTLAAGGANVQSAQVTLSYDVDERNDGVTVPAGLRIVKDDGAGDWVNIAVGGSGTAVGAGTIQSNTFTQFSDFTLASVENAQPLPIELLTFEARKVGEEITLRWITNREVNSDHFVVERSRDRINFTRIGEVQAQGNSSLPTTYEFPDRNLEAGVERYHYRLKMVDVDADFKYSEVRTVLLDGETELLIYPNPANAAFRVELLGTADEFEVEVVNALGQQVIRRAVMARVEISDLASGTYLVRVRQDGRVLAQEKVIVW